MENPLVTSRLKPLHDDFIEAAERYPNLFLFAACDAKCLEGNDESLWLEVAESGAQSSDALRIHRSDKGLWIEAVESGGEDKSEVESVFTKPLGIPPAGPGSWRQLLDIPRGKPAGPQGKLSSLLDGPASGHGGEPAVPKRESFVLFDGHVWHAAIFDRCPLDSVGEDSLERHSAAMAGVEELLRLSRLAYGNLASTGHCPCPGVDFPLVDDDADRWLEFVLSQPFVEVIEQGNPRFQGYVIRRTRGNVFTASAMAIESILEEPEEGTGDAAEETSKTKAPTAEKMPDTANGESASRPVPDAATKPGAGWMGDMELAEALGVHPTRINAFRTKLRRMRDNRELSMDCYQYLENPERNKPRFIYRADEPAIRAMAKRYLDPK